MNKIIFFLFTTTILLADCESNYIDYSGQCYHEDDIDFLKQLINTSQNGENPPSIDLINNPIELGKIIWSIIEFVDQPIIHNRLMQFCSSNSPISESECETDYVLYGAIPSLANLDLLKVLDLRNNELTSLEFIPTTDLILEYLKLSNNLIQNFPESF